MKDLSSRGRGPSLSAQNLFATAIAHHQGGRLADAERLYRQILLADPRHADALHNLGVAALQQSRNQEAADLIGKSLAVNKRNAEAHYHIGLAYAALGRFEDVETHNRRAVSLKPDHVQAHLNLGNALKALGRPTDAAASYRRAIALAPAAAEPHFNLANVLFDSGERETAVASYEHALAIHPDYAQARHNLAMALLTLNRSNEAIAHFDRVIAARPDFADALAGRALAAMTNGDYATAARVVGRALAIRATRDAKDIFCACARALDRVPDIANVREFTIAALSEPWDRPRNLVHFATLVLKSGGPAAAILARFHRPTRTPPAVTPSDIAVLAGDPLLRTILENAPIAALDLEAALAAARRTLLHSALHSALHLALGENAASDAVPLEFTCALARQCYLNEYVFDVAEDESADIEQLRSRLSAALAAQTQPSALLVAAMAAYAPLHAIKDAGQLLRWTWPQALDGLLTQQLRAPAEMADLRASIPSLTGIDNEISQKVRDQYESNPYPRWIKIARGRAARNVDAYLRHACPRAQFRELRTSHPDMLEAGCGTGQAISEVAQSIEGVRVLAVDLSLSSLAYAKRKTAELGLSNIEYAQADIMALPLTGKTFDIVSSCGVLHHMDDPFAAWRGLLGMLRPGGVMILGFYSERGRADVVAARELIANGGYTADAEGIRRARRTIAQLPPASPAFGVTRHADFYSISECRDLIFHVQEHRLTIAQIKAFIDAQNLTFMGFQMMVPQDAARYASRFPQDPDMTDLDCWDAFERDNPDAFEGMYQFWVQKPG